MKFFRNLFNSKPEVSKDENQQSDQNQGNEESKVPDRRLRSLAICESAGFQVASSLPTDWERQLRPKIEIAGRLHAIKALVLWLMVPAEDLPDAVILDFVERNGLGLFISDDESNILESPRDSEALRNSIGWKFENAWPLAWFFGYQEPDITGRMMTGEEMQDVLRNYTCALDASMDEWIEQQKTTSEEAVAEKEDLFYCLHNAVRSAQLGGATVPEGFDPMGNGGVIHERRHSLTYMLSKGISWDETDLST